MSIPQTVASVALLVFVACSPAVEESEVRIGVLIQPDTIDGPAAIQAVQLAAKEVNDAGGLQVGEHRLRVRMVIELPEQNSEDVTRRTLRLLNQEGVVALIGPLLSRSAISVSVAADEAGVPMVSPGTTHPEVTAGKPYAFRVGFTDPFQAAAIARFVREDLGADDAAVLYQISNTYSRGLAEGFRDAFTAAGGRIAAFEVSLAEVPEDADWHEALERIRSLRPAVLFLPNFTYVSEIQGRDARRLGITATLIGGDSWSPSHYAKTPELDGSYMVAPWFPGLQDGNPHSAAFIESYRHVWDQDPLYAATAQTYDAAGVLFEALRRAGRLDPAAVRDELAELEAYPGATGEITYRGTDGSPKAQGVLVQLRGGEVHFVGRMRTR